MKENIIAQERSVGTGKAKLTNSAEKVKFKIGEGTANKTIPHIIGLPEFNMVPADLEVTALDDDFVKRIGGLKDFGTLDFEFYWYEGETHYDDLVALEGKVCKVEITNSLGYGKQFDAIPYVKDLAQASGEAAKFGVSFKIQSDIKRVKPAQ